VVFFKFCFDDFPGAEEAASRFEEQKAWIEQVVQKAAERNQTLIIGNALPKVAMSTDPTLVAEHQDYNAWLSDYAANSGGRVYVYDFYGILADSDGAEKASYASATDDAHPNDQAYAELDPSFFQLLDEVAR
jgi:lysophospholipase L1-like esterase